MNFSNITGTENSCIGLKNGFISQPNATHDGIVEIIDYTEPNGRCHSIRLCYQQNQAFEKLVKRCGYSWNPCKEIWQKELEEYPVASFEEEARAIGRALLSAGFCIHTQNSRIQLLLENELLMRSLELGTYHN